MIPIDQGSTQPLERARFTNDTKHYAELKKNSAEIETDSESIMTVNGSRLIDRLVIACENSLDNFALRILLHRKLIVRLFASLVPASFQTSISVQRLPWS
jgi:hypothetical protein